MDQNIVKSINVRVTEEQKDLLDQMALEQNETLKDIILNGTIYSEEQKLHDQISNYKKEIKELEKLKQNEEQLKYFDMGISGIYTDDVKQEAEP